MNSYNELITLIDAVINRNGVQAITGQVLNGVLKAMVQQLGAGYSLSGVAHPTDDPGTPEQPVCYFASEVGTYTNFGGVGIVAGELALLCYDMTDGWFKETMYEGFASVGATIDGNVGTPAVNVTYVNGVLSFDFSNMKGNTGAAAGFGNVTAAVDGTSGTPGVSVQTDGPDTAKNIAFQFTGLKGETGVTSVIATVDNTSGTPQCAVSLNGQQLTLAFTGLKGAQGNTGSSVDYPYELVNNLTTNDATKGLSAAQGVVLDGKVTQLEAKVDDLQTGKYYGYFAQEEDLPETGMDGFAYVGQNSPYTIYNLRDGVWTSSNITVNQSPIGNEEDIDQNEDGKLQFANRVYNAQQPNGMGYKILRKDATFASQVTDTNTIYEIRYSFTLEDDEHVTIPSGCELRFNGGSISGGVLNLNNALLSGDVNITSEPDMDETDEFVEGYKPRNLVLPVSWFGANGDGLADDAPAIQRTIKWAHKNGATIVFCNGTYILGDGISDDVTDTDKSKHTGYSYPADYPMLTNDWTGINDRQAFLEANPNDIGRNIVLDFFKFSNLRIEGNGATVKSHDNNGYVRNNGMFRFWNCKGLTVLDLTVDANREGRMDIYRSPYWGDLTIGPSFVNSDDLAAAKSLASYLAQDVSWEAYGVIIPRGKVAGSRFLHSILLTNCSDTLFDSVNSVNGVVDGMSISSRDNKRITIKNGRIAHNQRHGIWLGLCNDVTVEKCVFEYAGIALDGETVMYMSGNTGGCSHIDCENESTTIMAKNNIIKNCHFGKSPKSGIVLSHAIQDSKVLNCTFVGSGIYSYRGRYCYNNEIAYCKLPYFGEAIHQEGMNFHHNTIDYEINDTLAKTLVSYSVNYSDSYVKGTESGLCSQTPSRFCNNIITIHYGSNIDSSHRNTKLSFGITDNVIMCDNVFANFDFADTSSGNFNVKVRKFKGNTFTYDTVKYPWLVNNVNKMTANGFSYRMQDIEIANPQINRLAYDVERRSSEVVVRISRTYSSATRYLIIKNALVGGTIKVIGASVDSTAPQYFREYFIHYSYSNIGQDRAIWYRDIFTPASGNPGGLRTNFGGVFELDTKVALISQPYYIEIHIPIVGTALFAEDLISFQSTQYAFTGTVRTATDISAMQDSVPVLSTYHRGQFNGATVYDKTLGKLLVKNDSGFIDVNGHPAAKSVGATADRPSASTVGAGFTFFDTDLGKMIVSNGTDWVNMDGTALS